LEGLVFDIKRFAVHDGPGIRTTVFLKGCPLSCIWCHNPEGISPDIVTVKKTVKLGDKKFIDSEIVGKHYSVDDLMHEILKEKIFMEESDGGVTFSGGEPLRQHEFLVEMLRKCKEAGIHTAVDTTGLASHETIEKVSEYTDLFLYDIKLINEENHKKYTGVSNIRILENLRYISQKGLAFRIRIPVIPNLVYTDENMNDIIMFLNTLPVIPQGVDLLPYHNTAAHKYNKFEIKNSLSNLKSLTKDSLKDLKKKFENAGFVTTIGG
jgi:pyruvate formate lyase activating enzyme